MRRGLPAIAVPLVLAAAGLAAGALLAQLMGNGGRSFLGAYCAGAWGSWAEVRITLETAAPLVLVGLAVLVPLKAGLFNVGGEGQMLAGAIAAVLAGALYRGPSALHAPVVLAAGATAGALWALVPALLKGRSGVHEVMTTILILLIHLVFPRVNRFLHSKMGGG